MPVPDWTKWSDVDNHLAKLIRDLNDRVVELERQAASKPMNRTFIHAKRIIGTPAMFCRGTTHVFLDDDPTCTCGMVPR